MKTALFICRIWQVDNITFGIEWNDGVTQMFGLSDIQKNCPCANCVDEVTGKRLLNSQMIQEGVRAVVIRSVGRYALHIQFTSGCSSGIYSFDYLRQLAKK